MISRPAFRLFNVVAMLAMLMNALAPAISQARAVAAQAGSRWSEVCSAGGSRWVRVDLSGRLVAMSDTRPESAPPALHKAACGYCLPHAGSFALPAPDPGPIWRPRGSFGDWQDTTAVTVPHPAQTWVRPALRGPPSA